MEAKRKEEEKLDKELADAIAAVQASNAELDALIHKNDKPATPPATADGKQTDAPGDASPPAPPAGDKPPAGDPQPPALPSAPPADGKAAT